MTDLSSPQIQATFKSNRRAIILTNAVMAGLALLTAGLAIWVAVEKTRLKLTSWSVWVFVALLIVIALTFAFIIVWELFLKRPYRRIVHRFVADCFSGHEGILKGEGEAQFELIVAGDRLTLFRQGYGDFVQFDLTPVRRYPTLFGYIENLVKRYLTDYYALNAHTLNIDKVTLINKLHGKGKTKEIYSAQKPVREVGKSFFVESGMIGEIKE